MGGPLFAQLLCISPPRLSLCLFGASSLMEAQVTGPHGGALVSGIPNHVRPILKRVHGWSRKNANISTNTEQIATTFNNLTPCHLWNNSRSSFSPDFAFDGNFERISQIMVLEAGWNRIGQRDCDVSALWHCCRPAGPFSLILSLPRKLDRSHVLDLRTRFFCRQPFLPYQPCAFPIKKINKARHSCLSDIDLLFGYNSVTKQSNTCRKGNSENGTAGSGHFCFSQ